MNIIVEGPDSEEKDKLLIDLYEIFAVEWIEEMRDYSTPNLKYYFSILRSPGRSLWNTGHLSSILEKQNNWVLDKDKYLRYDGDRGYIPQTIIIYVEPDEFDVESGEMWSQIIDKTNLDVLKVKGYVDVADVMEELLEYSSRNQGDVGSEEL